MDVSAWRAAPREKTPAYFPVYAAVALALQGMLRYWTQHWFEAHLPQILRRPQTALSFLVYLSIVPFRGRPTNRFTYDVQGADYQRALQSAGAHLKQKLEKLSIGRFDAELPRAVRERYYPYRSGQAVVFVEKNPRALLNMLHAETGLMDAVLKFALIDLPVDEERAVHLVHRGFATYLKRFSGEFDWSGSTDPLIAVATGALRDAIDKAKAAA